MNRNEEYAALLAELEQTPPELAYTIQRARARQKKKRRLTRCLGIPVGSLAVFFVSFTLLVNLLPTFAQACGGIPLLRELALAVAWSPSLSAAVEHDYVQPMNLEQTKNDITARIEYVIVDQKQLNIFYTLHSDTYPRLEAGLPEVADREEFSSSMSNFQLENGELAQYTLNFWESDVPDSLTFTMSVNQWKSHDDEATAAPANTLEEYILESPPYQAPEMLAEFTFTLQLDPWFTAQGETLVIDRDFTLDGQTLTLKSAEMYPSHMRLNFTDHGGNTAWLQDFDFYLENERGERIESISNGISASGDMRSNGEMSFHMESNFFSSSEHLTLHIQRVYWLEHDKEYFVVNLPQATADWLPQGIRLENTTRAGEDWLLTFAAKAYKENYAYSLVHGFTDADGNDIPMTGSSSAFHELDLPPGWFLERVPLKGYAGTEVYVKPVFSRVIEFETPVAVPVK